MATVMTDEQRHWAEQIVRRWSWASRLSVPADRTVEQSAVGEMAVALLEQLLTTERRLEDDRRTGQLDAA